MKKLLALAALTVAAALPASAALVYDTSALGELTGSRSSPSTSGIVIGGGDANSASLSWIIAYDAGANLYNYAYTFSVTYPSTVRGQQGISHFILDLSDSCSSTSGCVTNTVSDNGLTVEYGTFDTAGNPGYPGSITGIKWNVTNGGTTFEIEFDSNRKPVYGDFYAKAGNGESNGFSLWNTGATFHGSSENILDFIARPDTVVVECEEPGGCGPQEIPLPGTLALLGLGLFGVAGARRVVGSRTA